MDLKSLELNLRIHNFLRHLGHHRFFAQTHRLEKSRLRFTIPDRHGYLAPQNPEDDGVCIWQRVYMVFCFFDQNGFKLIFKYEQLTFKRTMNRWEIQDPKMEVLYHIRPYFVGIFPYIGLAWPYIGLIYGRYLQFRFLKWPLIWRWQAYLCNKLQQCMTVCQFRPLQLQLPKHDYG